MNLHLTKEFSNFLFMTLRQSTLLISVKSNSSQKKDLPLWKRAREILSDSAGFTLVELIITMAIVLVLSTLAIALYNNFIQKARETSVIVYLRYINKAELEYQVSNDKYAKNFDVLESSGIIPNRTINTIEKKGSKKRILATYKVKLKAIKKKWHATAEPVNKSTDVGWFYIDETGIVRFENGKKSNKNSPKL